MEYRKYGRSRLPSRIDRADTMRAAIALPSQIRFIRVHDLKRTFGRRPRASGVSFGDR